MTWISKSPARLTPALAISRPANTLNVLVHILESLDELNLLWLNRGPPLEPSRRTIRRKVYACLATVLPVLHHNSKLSVITDIAGLLAQLGFPNVGTLAAACAVGNGRGTARLALLEDAVEDFFSMYSYRFRCLDSDTNLVAMNAQHRDGHVVSDSNAPTYAASRDQHAGHLDP